MGVENLVGELPSGWQLTTLGQVAASGGGDIQTGPFGSQLHAADYVEDGIPSIMPKNIGDNTIVADGIARITPEDAARLNRYRVVPGDIVYSRRGDVEKRALIREAEDGWLCGTGCLRIRFGDALVDPTYASYYLGHPSVREWVVRHAHGATMPNLNTSILSSLPFVAPPIDEQRRIARVLGTLDDKIELNRTMNETLEEIARTLFTSWFVNFDPTRAKAAGKHPFGMDEATAALFPDSFVASELGPIPEGWEIINLAEAISITKGVSYKSVELAESTTALVTLKSFKRGGGYRPDGLKGYTGKFKHEQVVTVGELIVAQTDVTQAADVIGRPALVLPSNSHSTLVASLDVLVVRPLASLGIGNGFLYNLLQTSRYTSHVLGFINGTTVLHLSKEALPKFRFVVPPRNVVLLFENLVGVTQKRIESNIRENELLIEVRDTLLPKLLSGELRVPEAERIAEEVAV